MLSGLWGMLYILVFSKGNGLVGGEYNRGMRCCMTGTSPVTTIHGTAWRSHARGEYSSDRACPCHAMCHPPRPQRRFSFVLLVSLIATLTLTLFSTRKRLHKVRQQHIPLPFITVFKATLRGNLAYTYHLCRHLTRYYTLPLLLIGLLFFPLEILIAIMLCIVTSVDYWRLKPSMNWGTYAVCAILNDCAYEVGIVQGCIKYRTWKPLVPIIKMHNLK